MDGSIMQGWEKKGVSYMSYMQKKLCCIALMLNATLIYGLTPYYNIRSQGVNAARENVGITNFIHLDEDCFYGNFEAALEYTHSFNPKSITRCFFGCDVIKDQCSNEPAIGISGSQTTNRAPTDWLADYFGLPTDFQSIVSFKPYLRNVIVDLNFYVGLDDWLKGLYLRVDAPITQTKWHMRMRETVLSPGSNAYPNGYFSANPEPNLINPESTLLGSFSEFVSSEQVPVFTPSVQNGQPFPAGVFFPLGNARISRDPLIRAGVAEIRVAVGWDWVCQDYHVGANVRIAGPTGTIPKGRFAFEPIVGNGHHWELGAGFSAHYNFWHGCEDDRYAGFFVDARVTHLFSARQRRTFDLKCKPNSRYMLAQRIGSPQLPIHLDNPPFPAIEFQSEFSPVANLTTFDVDVSIAVQADLVLMLNYTHEHHSFDIGYNFWGITCEKIKKAPCPTPLDDGRTWALKGDASVIGFVSASTNPVRLAATETMATIHAGTNFPASGTTNAAVITTARTNPNIDSPELATAAAGTDVNIDPDTVINQTHSSMSPIFLSIRDVDLVGTRGLSNKVFAHYSYTWLERENWTPYLGFGAEAEFGNNGNTHNGNCSSTSSTNSTASPSCSTSCKRCVECSVSQWGIWLKGGVAWN
jgi:hypothetical protein